VEASKLIADHNEHPKRLLRILDLRQEIGCQSEGKRDFSGLVEVCLQDVLVEDQETFQYLELVLVGH